MRTLKTFFTLTLWMTVLVNFAQPWTYDFGTGTGTANNANAGSGNQAFFSGTPTGGGTYRVRVGNQGGSISLNNPGTSLGSGSELQLNAATGAATNKFSVFSWSNSTSVAYMKTKIRSTSSANGALAITMGTAPTGSSNNGYTADYAGTLASVIINYGSGAITSITRRGLSSNTTISSPILSKDADQDLEIYCNNGSTSADYFKAGSSYSLNSQSWDLWVGGTKVSSLGGWPRANTSGIVVNVSIGAISFFAESSTGNVANLYLDDLEYSNALPPVPTPVIDVSSPAQVQAANVVQATQNHVLSQFQVGVSVANAVLSSIACNTGGTYSSSDVTNFNLYYNAASNSFSGATSIASSGGSVSSGANITFSGLNTTITSGTTGYFFVTANFSASAVAGNTINIVANPTLSFTSGTPTGTITSGGSQTIEVSGVPDCAGVAGGSALPGTTCDDNNACTINDVWSASCVCAGTIQDTDADGTCDATDECDNDPNKILAGACGCGNIEVGQACNDNNACTENDVITACGVCAGTALLDTDSDGTCDLTDECDSDPNKILAGTCGCGNAEPTSACDDGNALTSGDVINGSCSCVGLYPFIYYDFGTAAFTTNTITNLAASAVTRGNNNGSNGLLNSTSASSGYAGSSGTNNAGAAARAGALDLTPTTGSAYFEFNLDADQNYVFTMTEVSFGVRSTGTGPQAAVLRSSLDGYTNDLASVVIPATSSWVRRSMVLSNFSTIAGANVTYRIYGSNGTGSPTANNTNWRIDDLNVFGYTTFTPPVSIVQFVNPTQSANESLTSDLISVTMDIAPVGDVVLSVADLGTGTATALSDYTFLNTSLTFSPTETYPLTKTVNLSILNDSDVEPSETINFGLSLTSGTATLGTSNLVYTLTSDDLAQLVINEIDYDNVGTDNSEWIEIKNNGATAVDINGYKLELVNGGSTPASVYSTINIATTSTLIQPGAYYVVGNNAAIANVNFVFTGSIQNGAPDAIGLRDNSNNLLDAVSYEGSVGSPYSEGLTTNELVDAASANFATGTIGRFPDGVDTGDNMVDLRTLCVGTPGATNTPSTSTFYEDNDADTFGNVDSTIAACEAPVGYVSNSTDCNDTSFVSNPSAVEICDGIDNDCVSGIDNGLTFVNYYNDADGDTYGAGTATNACQSPGVTYFTNNTDCDDAAVATYPGASEICDGIDNDCVSGIDNGLTFVNYYNDADGDTYGAGTATNACQSPGATYVTNNTDCNDALSAAYPGGTELCGNGIDDDCLGGDLICPVSPFEAAPNILNIGQFGTGVQATVSVNLATGTNTVQSPGLGLDKWYKFTATSNAMRIAVVGNSTVADDNDLSLYETPVDPTVQLIPIVSENDVHPGDQGLANDGGSETLIYDQLNVGDVYYLCVRNNNNTAGNVSLTLSNLNASSPDIALYTGGTNTFTSACQNFKVRFRPNASGYTINRWNSADISGTAAWSYGIPVTSTVASTVCQLGRFAPANLSGTSQTVFVTVDVLYNLKDAYGTTTPATARAVAASSFQLASEADLAVRSTDRCSAGFKSATSSIATNRSVCGTSSYLWEMSMVLPLTSLPLEVQGPVGGSRILMLSAVSGMANGQRYDVRIASKHVDGVTESAFGSSQCVKTIGAAGMPTIEEEVNMSERSENGITTTIYPNPNNGQMVNFSINGLEGSLNLKVTDATGREVYNNRFMVEGSMNTTMDFGQTLADGVYMVELLQNGELKTMRMVVSK